MPAPAESGKTPNGTAWSKFGSGSGSGSAVVLVHGVGMNQRAWAPQVQALQAQYHVVVYDMLGHGGSDLPQRRLGAALGLGDYTRQLHQLLQDLGVQRAHIVGHSMGALVALDMAIHYAAQCASVAALNSVFCRSEAQKASVQSRAVALAAQGQSDNLDGTIARWFGDPVPADQQEAARLTRQWLCEVNTPAYAAAYQVFAHSDAVHRSRLAEITMPALFATGAEDPNSTPAMSQAMHQCVAHSQLAVCNGQRHMMNLVDPAGVNTLLMQFIGLAATGTTITP
jgi:pimeloyl-ACP methyl ester carboxylesterase